MQLEENLNKKCENTMIADVDTYTQEQYEAMEKELADSINKTTEDFKNKYCVQPLFEITSPDKLKITIFNRLTEEFFKGVEIEAYTEWDGVIKRVK